MSSTAPARPPVRPPVAETRGFGGRFGSAGMPAERSRDFRGAARRLIRRLGPERRRAVAVVVLAVASVTLAVTGPMVLGHATDILFDGIRGVDGTGIDVGALHRTLLFALGLYVVSAVLAWLQSRILAGVVQRTMFRLREDVEAKLNRLPLGYVDRQPRGDLLSRVTNDIDNIAQSLQQTLSQLLTSGLTLVGVLVMMTLISPLLAVVALVTIPLSLVVMKQITKRSRSRFIAQWTHTGMLNAQVEEAFTGHAIVKVCGRQRDVEQRFSEKNQELYDAGFGAQFISGIIQPAMMFLGNLNYVAIALIGGLRIASGAITLGDLQAFIQYSRQFTQPLTQVASMVNILQSGIASAERIFELLDAEEEAADPSSAPTPATGEAIATSPVRGRVAFEDVSFSYEPDRPLIEDLSLVAEPGQTVAIVGPTGAGKTTLVNLILRFYELDGDASRSTASTSPRWAARSCGQRRHGAAGHLAVQRHDPRQHRLRPARRRRGGDPGGRQGDLRGPLRAVAARRLRHARRRRGRAHQCGGEAADHDRPGVPGAPALLILDEATSSVDTRTEVLIQRAMAALRSQRTSFVIAHRLSTIRDADLILVMEAGRIVERGTHAELLAQGGAYDALYHAQFAAAAVDA